MPIALKVPKPYLYFPDGALDGWNAAKAASGATPAVMAAIGDSITQGFEASDFMSTSWYEVVRAGLIARYGWGGDYYPVTHSNAFIPGAFHGTPPWTISGGTYGFANWGLGNFCFSNAAAAATNALQFQFGAATGPNRKFSVWQLVYLDWTAGQTWQFNLNGGAQQVVATNGVGYVLKTGPINGISFNLPLADHLINVGAPSAGGTLGVCGINVFPSLTPTGVFCSHFGAAGNTMQTNWSDAGETPVDKIAQLQGKGAAASGFGLPTQPHLAIICLGINDMQQALAGGPSGFQAGLVRMIAAVRRGQPNASIIILAAYASDPASGDITSGAFANSAVWWQYVAVMAQTAAAYQCVFASLPSKWGELAATNGFIGATDNHPVDKGHKDIANLLLSII